MPRRPLALATGLAVNALLAVDMAWRMGMPINAGLLAALAVTSWPPLCEIPCAPTGDYDCGRGRLDVKDGGLRSCAVRSVDLRVKKQHLRHSIRGTIRRHCSKRIELVEMRATCPTIAKRIHVSSEYKVIVNRLATPYWACGHPQKLPFISSRAFTSMRR
jgi:hypothetical protein